MAAQLNFPVSDNRFITITYQSNDYLNQEIDNRVKQEIAKTLVDNFDIQNIHSYVHGQIIVEVSNYNIISVCKDIVKELAVPMASEAPSLLYSVELASFIRKKTPPPYENLLYVEGSDEMNKNFLESIKEFYP